MESGRVNEAVQQSRAERGENARLNHDQFDQLLTDIGEAAAKRQMSPDVISAQAVIHARKPSLPPVPVDPPPPADTPTTEIITADAALQDEVGSYEYNVRELNEVRQAKQQLTAQLNRPVTKGDVEKSVLELIKLQLNLLAYREKSAREAVKLFNKGRIAIDHDLPRVRIEIVDWDGRHR